MYFKIAFTNIRKSYKDYSIYFLTLILAVSMFYSFNSIDSQKALIEIKSLSTDYILRLIEIISGVSVLVSIVLGGLILYANNFLIKKRKRELGIYMTLGMEKRKISRILVIETFIVGFISLVIGLILGIILSQGLSVFTLKLFSIAMDEYKFTISLSSINKTTFYFGIIFLLVMLFNIVVISRYKIIDLLNASKKNENIKFKNPYLYLVSFIFCLISLGVSYKVILHTGLDLRKPMFKISIITALLCTIAFFFSLCGVILYIANKNKKLYFKGLNIFILKQLNSKINTNFLSMSLICVMLFISIVSLSIGISFKKGSEVALRKTTPFDASIVLYTNDEYKNIENVLNKIHFEKSENEKYETYNAYATGIKLEDLFEKKYKEFEDLQPSFIKISEYNKLLNLKGEKEIQLNNNEVLLLSNNAKLIEPINENLKISNMVNIKGENYLVKNKNHKAIEENLHTSTMRDTYCTIIINDKFLCNYKIYESVLNIIYCDNNREENNKKYDELHDHFIKGKYKDINVNYIKGYSKDKVYSSSKGITTTLLFVGIYLGLVFLITSMAILALQQLSEGSDSIERYKALKKIGATQGMIEKTIFIQTFIYFTLPIILALIHSIIGIIVVNDYISRFNKIDIRFSILMTLLIFIIVYIGYFYTTYLAYKNMVNNNI